jgi:hypothetical protein
VCRHLSCILLCNIFHWAAASCNARQV